MPNKNYIKGRRFEYEIRDNLKKAGYFVIRSAGSHSPVDLIALNKDKVLCLQLKVNCRPTKLEWVEFYNISVPSNAYKIMVIKNNGSLEAKYVGKEPLISERKDLFSNISGKEVF
jgi:hypothetical protein